MTTKPHPTWVVSLFALAAASDLISAQSSPASDASASEPVELSPFVVNSTKDTGYQAMSTLAGTRLDTPLKDIGAAVSIYTKDFLNDIGATNTNELMVYATGMEAPGPGGNFSGAVAGQGFDSASGLSDDAARSGAPYGPAVVRSRGILAAVTLSRNFFISPIPTDNYISERVTVLRGPNAALFGVGSPSGIVDTTLARADLRKNANEISFRLDNELGYRATADFNRVLIPKKLAARLVGLQMREEFNQRPAHEGKKRLYGALTWQPFRSTTVRANFETGNHSSNRPLTSLPPISIPTEWYNAGRPGFDWTLYDDPARNPLAASQNAGNLIPFYMRQAAFPSIVRFYNNPSDTGPSYALQTVPPNTATTVANALRNQILHPTLNRDLAADIIAFTHTQNIGTMPPASYWIGGNVLPGQLPGQAPPGLRLQQATDFSAFDWENRMITEEATTRESFHGSNFTLEQTAWDNRIGVELSYDNQRYDNRMLWGMPFSVQGSNTNREIFIDTTVTLPNGLPNPNLGRPFARGSGNYGQLRFTETETRRASGFVRYNFKDLGDAWGKWLGRHTLSGLIERYRNTLLGYQHNVRDDGPVARTITPALASRNYGTVVYLGPSLIGNNNPLRLEPVRNPHLGAGPAGVDASYFARAANETDVGGFQTGSLSQVFTVSGGSFNREVIESRAAVLQSYWLGEHITTILGWRRDEDFVAPLFSPNFVANPSDPNDPGKVYWGFGDLSFPNKPPFLMAKETKSYSVVARWPQKLFKLPAQADLSVFYNNSENFTPGIRFNYWKEPLAPPEGKTKEHGINLSLFGDKLTLRFNRFENVAAGSGRGGNSARDIVIFPLNAILLWSREANVNPHLQAMRNADIELIKTAMAVPNLPELYQLTITGVAPNISGTVSNVPIGTSTAAGTSGVAVDPADVVAKGAELDIVYNPTPNWRILANIAKQETLLSNLAPFAHAVLPKLTEIVGQLANRSYGTYPQGWQIGDPLPATSETVGQFFERTVLIPRQIEDLAEGDPSFEQRKWRFNLVTNYRFGSGSWFGLGERLKGWSVGGAIRWQSKMKAGYPSSRQANGTPVFDKANPWYAPAETNIDAFVGYKRKIWSDRIDWKLQLNATNIYRERALIPVQFQPWGQPANMRLAPAQRWYLTNTFGF
jgi:catecholate siderophore receptor